MRFQYTFLGATTKVICVICLISAAPIYAQNRSQRTGGSIIEVKEAAYLRDLKGVIKKLDPKQDKNRTLYVGEMLRCDVGGLLKVFVDGELVTITPSFAWYEVRLRSDQNEDSVLGGRPATARAGGREKSTGEIESRPLAKSLPPTAAAESRRENAPTASAPSSVNEDRSIQENLLRSMNTRESWLARGREDLWQLYVLPDALFVTREGRLFNRRGYWQYLLSNFNSHEDIKVLELKRFNDVTILVYLQPQEPSAGSKELQGSIFTETYRYLSGDWRLISSTETLQVPPHRFDDFIGIYQSTQGIRLTVRRSGESLMLGFGTWGNAQLIPLDDNIFAVKGSKEILTFVKDTSGRTASLVYGQNGEMKVIPKKLSR